MNQKTIFPAIGLLVAVLATCLMCGCHDANPRWTNSYFHREENVKRICETLKGTYDVNVMRIIRCDKNNSTTVFKDSALQAMLPDATARLQYHVGGYGDQRIIFPDFPISLIAPCLSDTALARAVANAPAQNLIINYQLYAESFNDEGESNGAIRFDVQPLSLSLNINGKQQVVEFDFDDDVAIGIDGEDPSTLRISSIQFSLDDVKIIGSNKLEFEDRWDSGPSFDVYIKGEQTNP